MTAGQVLISGSMKVDGPEFGGGVDLGWRQVRAEGLVFSANSIGQKVGSGIGSAVLGWVLAAFGFVSSSVSQPASAISGIRVIFLYVPLAVFAAMFVILLFYKLDKEYDGIVKDLEKRG